MDARGNGTPEENVRWITGRSRHGNVSLPAAEQINVSLAFPIRIPTSPLLAEQRGTIATRQITTVCHAVPDSAAAVFSGAVTCRPDFGMLMA